MKLSKKIARRIYEERIQPRVKELPSGCWVLSLHDNGNGYIYLKYRPLLGKRAVGSHVIAHVAVFGPLKRGHLVLHRCDNRSCCRPEHTFSGTQLANIQDMDRKGRRKTWQPYMKRDEAGRWMGGARLS